MTKLLRRFLAWNRRLSEGLVDKFAVFSRDADYRSELVDRIHSDIRIQKLHSILEVGGIDRPLLEKSANYAFDGLDIEHRENCEVVYDNFRVQSIEDPVDAKYDMVISITLLEHVPDNSSAIDSIAGCLVKGGRTHHYIPSKWHPYSIALRIIGPKWQTRLIPLLRPGTETVTGYPAFFDHCSAPAMKKLFSEKGFSNIHIRAFYNANDYFAWFLPVSIQARLSRQR